MVDDKILNLKLAEWAGFNFRNSMYTDYITLCQYPDFHYGDCPDFTDSLDACFKWLIPEVMEDSNFLDIQVRRYIAPGYDDLLTSYTCEIWSNHATGSKIAQGNIPSLAICLAVEKLIDSYTADSK